MSQPDLLEKIQRRMIDDPSLGESDPAVMARLVREEAGVISDVDVLAVLRRLRHDAAGTGRLEELLALEGVTDVLVNGREEVWIDRGDGLEHTSISFRSDAEVRALATRLAASCGRRLDDAQPFADGSLVRADGSMVRVHAVLSPPAEGGTCLSLRVLAQARTTLEQLVASGTFSADIAEVLRLIIRARRSFLVVGGTGSGKTTLLSALIAETSPAERIICIEDTAELRPAHPHVLNLVSRGANTEGSGAIVMSDLLKQSLRMRPDRIIVGEIRGAEVVDLLAALNTGHDGGAGTIHANSLHEVLARMEALAALGGLGRAELHSQLAAAVEIVLVMHRDSTGQRRLHQIGVLRGNPVAAEAVWEDEQGPLAGYQHFVQSLATGEALA